MGDDNRGHGLLSTGDRKAYCPYMIMSKLRRGLRGRGKRSGTEVQLNCWRRKKGTKDMQCKLIF